MPINTTTGVVNVPLGEPRHINTTRILEPPSMVYEDEEPEILAVVSAGGWSALIGEERVHLVAFVALDNARMYGVAVGEDGRVDLVENDVEKQPNFTGYEQTNINEGGTV